MRQPTRWTPYLQAKPRRKTDDPKAGGGQAGGQRATDVPSSAMRMDRKGLILLSFIWWAGAESNCRHEDFQSCALGGLLSAHVPKSKRPKAFPPCQAQPCGTIFHEAPASSAKARLKQLFGGSEQHEHRPPRLSPARALSLPGCEWLRTTSPIVRSCASSPAARAGFG